VSAGCAGSGGGVGGGGDGGGDGSGNIIYIIINIF